MTSDLLTRLRGKYCCDGINTCNCDESADRIERLEVALLWYANHCLQGGDDIEGPSGDYGRRARAALDGKDFVDDQ